VRRLVSLAGTLVCVVSLLPLCTGCSGTGAPAEPADLAELRAIAEDQVTTVLLVKRWFAILYVRRNVGAWNGSPTTPCDPEWAPVTSLPTDPPGSRRSEGVLSDCTTAAKLELADGSGWIDYVLPDGRTKHAEWGPLRTEGEWTKAEWHQTFWDGAGVNYEAGDQTTSPLDDHYERGVATLADGRTMHWDHERNTKRDSLALNLDGGAALSVEVPLHPVAGTLYWPIFTHGARGTYTGPSGLAHTFTLSGPDNAAGWEECAFSLPDGTTSRCALAADLAGSGEIRRAGRLLASLTWASSGDGVLRPVGSSAIPATPSAAARDFAIDQWIRNIAELGPTPLY
jgi:hypothetical protein